MMYYRKYNALLLQYWLWKACVVTCLPTTPLPNPSHPHSLIPPTPLNNQQQTETIKQNKHTAPPPQTPTKLDEGKIYIHFEMYLEMDRHKPPI